MMDGTQNFRASELNYIENHPNARAIGIGKNVLLSRRREKRMTDKLKPIQEKRFEYKGFASKTFPGIAKAMAKQWG